MITIILLSHSSDLAKANKQFVNSMIKIDETNVEVIAIGGDSVGGLGSNPELLSSKIQESKSNDILIIPDLGSSVLAAQVVKEMNENKNIHIANAPFIEGAFAGITLASAGIDFKSVIKAAEEEIKKL